MAFTPVTVTATFAAEQGVPSSGSVEFTLTSAMSNGGVVHSAVTQSMAIVNGVGSIVLNANTDVGTVPSNTGYRVTEYVNGSRPRTYAVILSAAAPTVALASMIPASVGTPIYGYLTSDSIGTTVAGFNSTGQVVDRTGAPVVSGAAAVGAVFPFTTPSSSWTITHSLGRFPLSVQVVVGTSEVLADVDIPNATQVVITHAVPTAGRVTLI